MSILTDISSGAVGGLLGGVGTLAKDIRQAITGDLPAEKRAEIEQKLLELENSAMASQNEINKIEAASEDKFVSRWRPFIGWVGGFALAYQSIVYPVMCWVAKVGFNYMGEFPKLDGATLSGILVSLLGVGVMRSYDKWQQPNPKGKE